MYNDIKHDFDTLAGIKQGLKDGANIFLLEKILRKLQDDIATRKPVVLGLESLPEMKERIKERNKRLAELEAEISDKKFADKRNNQKVESKQNNSFTKRIICDDKIQPAIKLRGMIEGKRGKDVAMIIQAAIKKGVITKPTFSEVQSEFGDIGHKSGYDKYMRYKFTDEELQPIIDQL